MLIHPHDVSVLRRFTGGVAHLIAFFERFSLIMELFSTTKGKREFDASGLRIERQRDDCQAANLRFCR